MSDSAVRRLHSALVEATFAEAFAMWGARALITAATPGWALTAAQSMTGFATSIIGCKCEAGIEREWRPEETPDGRPGVSVLLFAMDAESLGKRLTERIGQCVLTCATTACYNGLDAPDRVGVGRQLRFFGDGYQISKVLNGRRFWRVPVMDGEFVIEEEFGVQPAVGGGNLLILGTDLAATLRAAEAAARAMREVRDAILPFPGGLVRSGSKVGGRYKSLPASTNDAYCPTLRGFSPASQLPPAAGCVLEIVIDGLTPEAVRECMRRGLHAAAQNGALGITAGNYEGKLGQYQFGLWELLGDS